MEEYANNVITKLEPYINGDETVVEIGIASGITCFGIAPKVKLYYGVDISQETLDNTEKTLKQRNIMNVHTLKGEAINIEEIGIPKANIFIINSVCQYFPGYNYFFSVIGKMISKLQPNGIIFLGDLLDYKKMEAFDKELKIHDGRRNHRDLWYPKEIISELPNLFPQIREIEISSKVGNLDNELKKYRFDCI